MSARRIFARPARYAAIAPYLWMVLFFLVPFGFVLKIALSQTAIAQPPYTPLFDLWGGREATKAALDQLSLDNFKLLISDNIYILSYLRSLTVALLSTAILLVIGYPIAYGMARCPPGVRRALVMAVILPFWTSFLIRIYAWIAILKPEGLLNALLRALGLPALDIMDTDIAVYVGLVYAYLPFMVLPLYAVLERQDQSLLEAAADLGCTPTEAFWRVTFPMSLPGVAAGALLCFIPMAGEFVIPDLMGGSETLMLGRVIWTEFFANRDWPAASAVAIVLLATLVIPILLFEREQAKVLA